MKKVFLAATAIAALLPISSPLMAQDDDATRQLEECRGLVDIEERLDCYDNIGKSTPAAEAAVEADKVDAAATPVAETPATSAEVESAAVQDTNPSAAQVEVEPAAAAAAATAAAPQAAVADPQPSESAAEFGLPREEDTYQSIRANVVRCGRANDYKFYFYLDNGQVWRYVGGNALRYSSCNSPATLTEDGLGFELQMDGKQVHRVRRVR